MRARQRELRLADAPSLDERFGQRQIERKQKPADGREHDERTAFFQRDGNHRMGDQCEHGPACDGLGENFQE